jgi:hypothetical protein
MRFDAYDVDNSKTLSKEEVGKLFLSIQRGGQKIGRSVASGLLTSQIAAKYFGGSLQTPFLNIVTKKPTDKQEIAARIILKHIFALVDKYFSQQEIAVESHVNEITEKIFELADTDKNGILSRDEFVRYFTEPEIQKNVADFAAKFEHPEVWQKMGAEIQLLAPTLMEEIAAAEHQAKVRKH